MQIEIHGETERLIRMHVSSGGYASPEEVIDEAVRQLGHPENGNPSTAPPRQGGYWKGRVVISDDFDKLPPDLEEAFGVSGS